MNKSVRVTTSPHRLIYRTVYFKIDIISYHCFINYELMPMSMCFVWMCLCARLMLTPISSLSISLKGITVAGQTSSTRHSKGFIHKSFLQSAVNLHLIP